MPNFKSSLDQTLTGTLDKRDTKIFYSDEVYTESDVFNYVMQTQQPANTLPYDSANYLEFEDNVWDGKNKIRLVKVFEVETVSQVMDRLKTQKRNDFLEEEYSYGVL